RRVETVAQAAVEAQAHHAPEPLAVPGEQLGQRLRVLVERALEETIRLARVTGRHHEQDQNGSVAATADSLHPTPVRVSPQSKSDLPPAGWACRPISLDSAGHPGQNQIRDVRRQVLRAHPGATALALRVRGAWLVTLELHTSAQLLVTPLV